MTRAELGLENLAEAARSLMRSSSLIPLLETATEEACKALHAATISISCIEIGARSVRTILNSGDLGPDEERWPENEVYQMDSAGRLASALNELTSWVDSIDDPDCDPYERTLLGQLGKGSSLATAIVVDGQTWGEFYATRHIGKAPFDAEAIAYAEVLVAILGGAISRSLREETLESLAFTDPLTALFNRRGFALHADALLDVPAGETRTLTAVALDINALKQTNDTHGHARGDQLIRSVAQAILDAFGDLEGTIVSRAGGDEFAVLVPDADIFSVIQATHSLCDRTWDFGTGVGVSAGIASAQITHDSKIDIDDLHAAADRAQYVAKRAGLTTPVVSGEFTAAEHERGVS